MQPNRGELTGVRASKFKVEKPYGMTLINGGAIVVGSTNDELMNLNSFTPKTVSVSSFFMDETEITNGEYMQFVKWVRDSIARQLLAERAQELGTTQAGIGEFAYENNANNENLSEYETYMIATYGDEYPGAKKLNWDAPLTWDFGKYYDQDYAEIMDYFYLPPSEWFIGIPKLDVKKFKYRYTSVDYDRPQNTVGPTDMLNQEPFISEKEIEIYPDTAVWIKDFYYSYNEPMHNNYFWHPAYRDYPVVGVNWHQANAFCQWRTNFKNIYRITRGQMEVSRFRLPSEIEWEYAARGGIKSGVYPWGTNLLIDERGRFLANFKPDRGDYTADYALYTVEAKSYKPNGYNLYNMAGNVSEWTNTSYVWNSSEYAPTLNPNLDTEQDTRKVIKGGSWKDVAYFLQVSSRDYEYADSAKSFIGFRAVQDVGPIR